MSTDSEHSSSRLDRIGPAGLCVIVALFLAVRVPVMYRQPGGYDEETYAVPGLTVLKCGIPQLPHVPARNPESVFFHADKALYSEPPLYFYYQAAFYFVLPDVYGTGRLASGIAGVLLIVCVYRLALTAGSGICAALSGAGLFSISRWFFFPAICARPDTLCALFGFIALLLIVRWHTDRRRAWLLLAGVCLGLGGLTHFFAVIYAIQSLAVVVIVSRGRDRLINAASLTAPAVLVFSLWLPLISIAPDLFQVQLRNQLGGNPGGPIWRRALLPWASLSYHLPVMWDHIGSLQWLIPGGGLLFSTRAALSRGNAVLRIVCGCAWSSIYLICVLVGPHHPVIGYWVYPAGLFFVGLAYTLHSTARGIGQFFSRRLDPAISNASKSVGVWMTMAAILALAFLPGSGLRTLWVHLRHWNDINYDAPRFARSLMLDRPPEEVCAVDSQFVLDFVAAGRPTLFATDYPLYLRLEQFHYDRLIVSRHAIDKRLAQQLGARFVGAQGIENDRFACYAEIYVAPDTP